MPTKKSSPKARALVNLFEDLPEDHSVEHFAEVCKLGEGTTRIERIVSHGQASPKGFWHDQEEDEWILILQGQALLRLKDQDVPISLKPGDSLLLPAHCPHRIDWTTPDQATIWLAVFPDSEG